MNINKHYCASKYTVVHFGRRQAVQFENDTISRHLSENLLISKVILQKTRVATDMAPKWRVRSNPQGNYVYGPLFESTLVLYHKVSPITSTFSGPQIDPSSQSCNSLTIPPSLSFPPFPSGLDTSPCGMAGQVWLLVMNHVSLNVNHLQALHGYIFSYISVQE